MTLTPEQNLAAILNSPTYKLAELDTDLLQRDELRPVRMQLELLKPELQFAEQNVDSTVVVFGGTQIVAPEVAQQRLQLAQEAAAAAPHDQSAQRSLERAQRIVAKAPYYEQAREFARLVSSTCQVDGQCEYVIVTGGGTKHHFFHHG